MPDNQHSYKDVANNTADKVWKDPGLRKSMIHILVLYTAVFAVGYDGSLLNGFQALPAWKEQFGNPTGYALGLIAASYYLPKVVVPFLVAPLCDRFGRKLMLLPASLIMIAGTLIGTFGHTRGTLIGSRVLLGTGTSMAQITAGVLITEVAHPRIRHLSGSFFMCMYYVGSILASWLTFGMVYVHGSSWAWRAPSLIQGLGPAILLLSVFGPESPRWLLSKGRRSEAHAILAKYHANGLMDDELVLFELSEIETQIAFDRSFKDASWFDWFKTPVNRTRFGIVCLVACSVNICGNGVVSYYLVAVLRQVGITSSPAQAGINGAMSVCNFLSSIVGASLVERFGRRPLFLTALSGMLASFAIITGLSGGYATHHQSAVGTALVPFIFIFMMFYSSALTPIPYLYNPEILPTSLRAKGLSLHTIVTGLCLVFNNFVNPIALAAIQWKLYIVYDVVLVVTLALFYFFVRETRGLTTEEAAMVYETDEVKAEARVLIDIGRQEAKDDAADGGKGFIEQIERKV